MDVLSSVKLLTGLDDDSRDDLLQGIISITEMRLLTLLGCDDVPKSLQYILIEVSVSRFNRIGSEGTSAHTVSGETMTYRDDDFAPYLSDIEAYKDTLNNVKKKIRFL